MFYCEDCRKRNDWPDSLSLSRGQCEACGKTAHCYDRPSSTLPMPKRGEMTTVREAARDILDLLDHGQPVSWEDIRALRHALEADTVEVPRVPSDGRLASMAIRDDHGLGVPGYYDQPLLAGLSYGTHQQHMESAMSRMRQLYEEATGQGFYRPEHEETYRQVAAAPSQPERGAK